MGLVCPWQTLGAFRWDVITPLCDSEGSSFCEPDLMHNGNGSFYEFFFAIPEDLRDSGKSQIQVQLKFLSISSQVRLLFQKSLLPCWGWDWLLLTPIFEVLVRAGIVV